ncbi:MAG: GNAT family N-acetyltransferase [Methanomicrobium sp.]|nr:GNAT family N-acetyltransferase [Methanomicrobium sp.]
MKKYSTSIKEAGYTDLNSMKSLYYYLFETDLSGSDSQLRSVWDEIISDSRVHPFILFADGIAASSCTLSIIPNLTWGARPYGLIENVVTKKEFGKNGFAGEILKHALNFAWKKNCYKVMLLTGRKEDYVMRLYEHAGFKAGDKKGLAAYNPDFSPKN